jgi:flagellin-like hook-associated protein FlgL
VGNGITLGQASRESLLSLKSTKAMANKAASRISTGLKVATASDDAVSYFQAASLTDRSKDFLALKNGIDQGISTLSAALDSTTAIESTAKQMKGLVLSTAGMTTQQRTDVALQWDDLRNQITNLSNDAVYDGVSLLANTDGFSVDVSPAGEVKVEVPGRDLRANGGVVDDIAAVWADDSDGDGTYTLATRNFSTAIVANGDENIDALSSVENGFIQPRVSRLSNGNTVQSWGTFTGGSRIANIRIKDANGDQVGNDITFPVGTSSSVNISGLTDGRFVASWSHAVGPSVIYAIYEADGTVFKSATNISGSGFWVSSTPTASGGFVLTWTDNLGGDGSGFAVYSRAFDAYGTATTVKTQLNQTTFGDQRNSTAAGLTGGSAIITWYDSNVNSISGRFIDSNGSVVGNEFRIDNGLGTQASYPFVAPLKDGGFAVVWRQNQSAAKACIQARIYNYDGTPRGNQFPVSEIGKADDYPKIAAISSGGFAVAWTASSVQDGSGTGCYMSTYDANGNVIVSKQFVNHTKTNNQSYISITSATLSDILNEEEGELEVKSALGYGNFATAADRDRATKDIDAAIDTIRSAAGHFVSSMNLLSTRLDFSTNYAGTLSAGAGKLTLADLNDESANLLALQSRSQLGVQALTFATQSEQAILKIMK